ncbi:hypothetical protein D8674_019626 [Pyrus ussuriensis x Pyrus communis]|uniref:Myb-like domain-containing protein n=1 Tax=Pyrus ussuriensis x Pyrus communis TaxID=2448454 RepID=A0A5N5GLH1_9ROSA|nr:hypothetical protein D8674_019626 [Pyrus ussuriensis x Pyrus communis]
MASSAMKGRAWTRKEDEALCGTYRWISKDSVRGISQTSEGVWTRVSKNYLEFYEGPIPLNTRNNESCFSRWKKHIHPSLNNWYQALLASASRHESGVNYYDEIRQAEELYMEGSSKPIQFHGCWEICKGWVLFEDPPQHRAPTPVFRTASSAADMDEDGSLAIQQIRVENPSSGEGSIPRDIGRNKVRRLKEKGKANDDYAAQHEVAALLRLMAEQNALQAKERKSRHEERVNQIQEEMDDKNMDKNTLNYTSMKWIKIGDEYFENPVAITPAPQVITVIAMDSSFHSGRNKQRKSMFEAEDQGNAPFLTARSVPANLQTEFPEIAFIKNLSHNLKEKHVQLHVINRHFLSPTDEMEPEEELASPFSFRTKRRYLYK